MATRMCCRRPGALALIQEGGNPETVLQVMDLETGETHPLTCGQTEPYLGWFMRPPTWAENDTVFIPTGGRGVVLTFEHTP
jgi:hypothetical protein